MVEDDLTRHHPENSISDSLSMLHIGSALPASGHDMPDPRDSSSLQQLTGTQTSVLLKSSEGFSTLEAEAWAEST